MIALTGATGFVGRAVIARASSANLPLRLLVRNPIPAASPHSTVVVGNLAEPMAPRVVAGCRVIIHCAARAHVMRDDAVDPEAAFYRSNVEGTMRVAEAAVAAGVPRMVFVSSIKVLGEATAGRPLQPLDPYAPEDAYGRSKAEAERQLLAFGAAQGLEVAIIRPVLVYGPGMKGNLHSLMQAVRRGVPLPLGGLTNRRSLVSVDSLADLLILVACHPRPTTGVWHAADREPLSTSDLIGAIARGVGRPARLISVPEWLLAAAGRVAGRQAAVARLLGSLEVDASTTVQDFGWEQGISSAEGLAAVGRAG